ncbi:hypothetical protein NON00_04690 [Roseomonas sp. GC11]|uniref:sigma factor n=1 Tax=Roseomonas sp. GC11 TaxID=2950546 RepID=UPI00210A3A4D|nr:sigma factor [Roseomonas sp. GC11]MCQ4159219.1 hypothetical protein [Roseomonas sp. GC11]
MPATLLPTDLAALQRDADRVAQRIIHTGRMPRHEQEDLRQDLLVDLLARLKGFEPHRGSLGAFAASCFEHHALRLATRFRRGRAAMTAVALDAPQPGRGSLTIGDTLAEAEGYGAWLGQPTGAFAAVERRLDLDRALGALSADQIALCAQLVERTPHAIAKGSRVSRATLYRQLAELRLRLLAAGIPAAA